MGRTPPYHPTAMTDPCLLPATETLRRLHDGRLSRTAVIEATLDRIARLEPGIRAFVWHQAPAVRRTAAVAAMRDGPLAGLLLGAKDVLDTADAPSQYGSAIWAGHRPRADATAIALARRAGAVVVGKTVTTEFATRHPGPTANPANLAHTPGGSSSGSAAGVAAGFFHLGYGTQTAGSIIRPAAYCGVVGCKPSFGTLHRAGMKVMSESLDTIGVMARTTGDCALFLSAVTGLDFGDPDRVLDRAPRLGLCWGPAEALAAPETRALFDRATAALTRAGAGLTPVLLPPAVAAADAIHPTVMTQEIAAALAWEWDHARTLLSPGLQETVAAALAQPAALLEQGRQAFATARLAFADAIAPFDAILTPSAAGEAPEGLHWTGDPAFNRLWTALHVPCVTVPAGEGPRGLPLGVQIVAANAQDARALAVAEWVHRALA